MGKVIAAVAGALLFVVLLVMLAVGGAVSGGVASMGNDGGGAGDAAAANIPAQYQGDVTKATQQCKDLRASLLAAQIWQESKWDPKASSGVANGITQFTPATWIDWGRDGDGDGKKDVWNPHDGIAAQGAFMCYLYKTIKADMASRRITRGSLDENVLAAYNGGPGLPEAAGGFPTGVAQADQYAPAILAKEKDYQAAGSCGSCPSVSGPYAQRIVALLRSALGVPYVLGGGSTSGATNGGYDCSGLTTWAVYHATGGKVTLTHLSAKQHVDPRFKVVATGKAHSAQTKAAVAQAQPGDLITFNVPQDPAPWGHVGLAIGGGRMIHAPQPGGAVENVPIYQGFDIQVARLATQK